MIFTVLPASATPVMVWVVLLAKLLAAVLVSVMEGATGGRSTLITVEVAVET
jgi:hypothetical protein